MTLYLLGSAQTYSKIVWLLHLKRCFWLHYFKIKRPADFFYCYPSLWQRRGIKYEENKINLVKFSFLSEALLLYYSQLNQPFSYIGRVYVPYIRRSCHYRCSCKQRDEAVCSTVILRPECCLTGDGDWTQDLPVIFHCHFSSLSESLLMALFIRHLN